MNPALETFFDQIASYQVLMDLLYKNQMYDEVMQVMDMVKDKQIAGSRFPRNVVVLAMAAAYKKVHKWYTVIDYQTCKVMYCANFSVP